MDITHDNVCSSMLSCFYSHLLSTGRLFLVIYIGTCHIFVSPAGLPGSEIIKCMLCVCIGGGLCKRVSRSFV